MSYILEALKKSNRERTGEGRSDLHIVQNASTLPPRPRLSINSTLGWILLLCAFLFVCTLFLYNTIKKGGVSGNLEVGRTQIVIAKKVDFMDTFDELRNRSENTPAEVVVADSPYVQKSIKKNKQKKVFLAESPEQRQEETPAGWDLPLRLDLPKELQAELPKLHFAGHTYAENPSQRLIIINSEIRREGDRLDKDTRLVEIVWEGVVLEYKGVVFVEKLNL